jgi:murein DD-endopeptidase MepM/ murein hydrolase activator NlpD
MAVVSGYARVKAMRLSILNKSQRNLARGCAVFLIAGLASGCSSTVARFSGVDDIFTATTNRQQIMQPANQPYPGDQPAQVASAQPTGVSNSPVGRSALAPVAGTQVASAAQQPELAQAVGAATQAAPQLASAASTVKSVQPVVHAAGEDIKGWSRAGGSQITAKEGETIYNLSRRFGVPVDVIAKANGLSNSAGLQAGQKIIIPTYGASGNNSTVAAAKPASGTKHEVAAAKTPPAAGAAKVKEVAAAKPVEAKPAAQSVAAGGSYKVQEGDTLSRIAKKTGVSVAALKQANSLHDGAVRIGQALTIPSGNAATKVASAPASVDKVTTASTGSAAKPEPVVAYTPPKKAEKVIEQAEEDTTAAPDSTGVSRMRWPVRGRVISSYGAGGGKDGDGIDIAVPEGTSVKAAENGVVIYAGDGLKEFGNTVLVRHENGLVTVYGHASELEVARGDKVKRGQEIARSGMSGTTDMPKLHFEVRKNSTPVDPTTFLE